MSFLVVFIGTSSIISAQKRFNTMGNSSDLGFDCFRLTEEQPNQDGAVWSIKTISLNNPFDISFNLFFGCKDGADGITFALQADTNDLWVIDGGGGLGIYQVAPSIAVEFDDFCNSQLADPGADHIAVIKDGEVDHNNKSKTLAGPVQPGIDFEDCAYHKARVVWNPATQNLKVYFDCQRVVNLTYDIINNIFSGNPNVYWGFTGATGGLNNRQEVCLNSSAISGTISETKVCPGSAAKLNARNGNSFLWNTSYGLSDSTIRTPTANPEKDTLYIVQVIDNCGDVFYDSVRMSHYKINVKLPDDTAICKQQNMELKPGNIYFKYKWSTGETTPKITIERNGKYWLTVTDTNNCQATDTFELKELPWPKSGLPKEIKYWSATCDDSLIGIQANKGYQSYLWSTADTTDNTAFFGEGLVWITMNNGICTVTDTAAIKKLCASLVYVPNAFSANNDNLNDGWKIVCENCDSLNVRIFNRWGQLVFETSDLDASWDGTFKQKPCPVDVYFYVLMYSGYADGSKIKGHVAGNIQLLR